MRGSRPSARASWAGTAQANSTPAAAEQRAARRVASKVVMRSCHLRWNSGAISSERRAPAARLSARAMACARLAAKPAARAPSRAARPARAAVLTGSPMRWRYRAAAQARRSRPPRVGEALRRGRPPERLARCVQRLQMRAAARALRRSRAGRDQPFARPLELRGARPGLRRLDQRLGDCLRSPSRVEEALRQPLDQRRRRLVGDEMARELARDMRARSPDGARDRPARRGPAPTRSSA